MLKRTPFHEFHVSAGAKLVDFAGWEMPLMYRGIVQEHQQTRESGSIFDVSHMGRLHFSGPDVKTFLAKVLTRRTSDMVVGQSRYAMVCNEAGGILDDVIVSRDTKNWLIVCNAANREKLIAHFHEVRRSEGYDFDMADQTEGTAMVAIQGPKVIDRLSSILPVDLKSMKRYQFESTSFMLIKFTIFRGGYTGEDGVELILPAKMASMAMKLLGGKMDKPDATIQPAGLGARDTLRLEAGLPLYGHELSEQIDPISAGMKWVVDLEADFIGSQKIREIAAAGPARKLVGMVLEGRRIARQGAVIKTPDGSATVGEITSGTFGPTVQKSIAMGYVDTAHSAVDTQLAVDFRGDLIPATIVKLPFYKRAN